MQHILFLLRAALVVSIFTVPLLPKQALAHKVNVFAWVEGDTVQVEGYFSGGKKVRQGLVEVFDPAGKKLLEGRTNDQGEFSFKVPQKSDLKIVLTASMGHKNDFTIPESELEGTAAVVDSHSGQQEQKKQAAPAAAAADTATAVASNVSAEQLQTIMEKVLDRKLAPLFRRLGEEQAAGPGLSKIIAGIGYIIGIMGLAMFWFSKKKT
ncbi:MAG: hypothetical protein JRJ12_03790 [Deltaproteobacteria bacterium]|nr:hypothetical protein [Deltaproteobacteria bacterium]MBW2070211.1 hypothetical protein [Deltaproteobacteria bacterium]